jgi:CRISPR-associated endonuclease/helicase Cas3
MSPLTFREFFKEATGHPPFPWQERLFEEFLARRFPNFLDIPTGLGKTSIIAIWLFALAEHARAGTAAGFPRRLAYVVNRRTVVDQATREVEGIRRALANDPALHLVANALRSLGVRPSDPPLAISTLRGQFADKAEWKNDPARPAVIIGTVDMIGSRLLFAGYGCGFKSSPLHAGFLGQDTMLVHDEAHLEPAFQELVTAIESEQQRCRDFGRIRVMALTATGRGGGERFVLTAADRNHREVRKRIEAKKGISFCPIADEKNTTDEIVQHAKEHKDGGEAILVFVRKLEQVEKVAEELRKAKLATQTLTGTLRGLERDTLAGESDIFARFMPKSTGSPKTTVLPRTGTVYLVCTSAGEVGIDISADHLVCDLTPFDSMAQRFGRVNRFGDGDAQIDVIHTTLANGARATEVSSSAANGAETERKPVEPEPGDPNDAVLIVEPTGKAQAESPFDQACRKTLSLLQTLPKREDQRRNASPAALGDLPDSDRHAAFTPPPVILPTSDILFDTWALTSIRQKLPGRPPVADWLHGIAEREPPETHVAWREEVECLTGELLESHKAEDLLEDYPLKPHELLRDRTDRVFKHLEKIAERNAAARVWIVAGDGSVDVMTFGELEKFGKDALNDRTVLLPPEVGGLAKGMLSGGAGFDEAQLYDVSDLLMEEDGRTPRRLRVWDDGEPPRGMRLIRTIDTRPDAENESEEDTRMSGPRYWRWYARPRSADDDGSRFASRKQDLEPHLQSSEHFAREVVSKLALGNPEALAVTLAAKWHDLGKDRQIWQGSIGNRDYPRQVLAKSGSKMQPMDLGNFRHEFGSLLDVMSLPEFRGLEPDVQDLVLHMIASHHGRARPHFPLNEAFDPEHAEELAAAIAREVPRRFARLQRTYGRWGLAYLESLVRAADALASMQSQEAP